MAEARLAMTKEGFYHNAEGYWKGIPATVDGMLGGFSDISGLDIAGSQKFLKQLYAQEKDKPKLFRALDCGAGIGRVSKHLLLQNYKFVDMLELNQAFLDEAKNSYLGESAERVEKFICMGLQDFVPEPKRYDLIWCQWVLGHLNDEHLVRFLKRCKEGLTDGGMVCVKENMTEKGLSFDEEDSSVTRSNRLFRRIFEKSGWTIVKEALQTNFPVTLYPVKMWALKWKDDPKK
ncbi:N-terminal Xaa-Pro-Lys N-methyltransferase 1-like [Ptychodera flava]|uniref:N-terminal Xaa-Pro-Lys N-methyltransferase 1-like n=1 Tax=Ptychodera flava TaxID=63121 RepID=UPI00396A47A8